MTFNDSNLELVLSTIEENLHFDGEGIFDAKDWVLSLNLDIQDIINKSPNEVDKIKYIIKVMNQLGYLRFANNKHNIIEFITEKGYRFMFLRLHNIDFKY